RAIASVRDPTRFQPLAHQSPCGEGAQRREYGIMAEPVECRLEISVESPQSLRGLAARDGVDGHDRVMAAPARPEPVGLRLQPGPPPRVPRRPPPRPAPPGRARR